MSPPDSSSGDEDRFAASTASDEKSPTTSDDSQQQPPQQPHSNSSKQELDTLGEALAGVSLHSQASAAYSGSSALATALAKGTSGGSSNGSTNAHEATTSGNTPGSGAASSSSAAGGGWDSYPADAAAASNVFSGVANATGAAASNESLTRFLSRDPSHTLGDDVFKLSHNNLPALNYEETNSDTGGPAAGFGGFPGQSSLAPGSGVVSTKSSFNEFQTAPEPRRDSPSAGTGTTASSRSSSPYENGGPRKIPSYQPDGRNVSSDSSSGGYNSLTHAHGSHPSLSALATQDSRSPYAKGDSQLNGAGGNSFGAPRSGGGPPVVGAGGGVYDQQPPPPTLPQQVPPQDPNQPQVLYMAVPSPDGRGQVLQPVQMLQLPGKPYTYVVPGAAAGNNAAQGAAGGGFIPDQQQQASGMMTLPPLPNNGNEYSNDLMQRNRNGNNGGFDQRGGTSPYDSMGRAGNGGGGVDDYNRNVYGGGGAAAAAAAGGGDAYAGAAAPQRPPLDTLLGQVRRLSRDQVGCRLVQQALDEEGPMAATLILNEGLAFWGEAMVDPFGNYLFQKILEKVTAEERVMLVKSVSTRLVNASLNLHGTRSVQKVVELCAQDEQNGETEGMEETAAEILTKALTPAAARLCIDSHGNHVIQRILLKLGPKHSKFVFDAVAASVGDVARHRHGCCVIQRCLDSPPNESRSHLVDRIVEKSLELMQDAYGNYVVQYVLDVCSDEDVQAVCESVVGKVNLLAIQKFSSNVMEKCLERCDDRVRELYLAQMSDPDRIRELMMDPFGNYVVQRALSVATHAQAIRLVEAMRPHLIATQTGNGQRNGGVRNTAGGRRIIAKICRRFPNFTLNPVGTQDELYSQNKGNHHHHHRGHHHHHHHQHANHHQQQQHHHHQHANQGFHQPPSGPVIQAPYATVGGPAPPRQPQQHYMNDPRLITGPHIPMQQQHQPQQQQQSFYGLGGGVGALNGGYYDQQQQQTPFSNGGLYPGM